MEGEDRGMIRRPPGPASRTPGGRLHSRQALASSHESPTLPIPDWIQRWNA